MYCPSCGTPADDTSKYCAKCGAAMPINLRPAPQGQPASSSYAAAGAGWRLVGMIALVGALISVLTFFMAWLTTPALNLGGPSLAGQINGWALFRIPFDVLGTLSQSRGGNQAAGLFGYLPGQMQLFLIIYLIDSVLLILTPLLGIAIAVNSWQMLQAGDDRIAAQRQRRNKRLALIGLIPPLVLLVLIVVLVAVLSSQYGQSSDLGLALRLFDFGFWLTVAALAGVTLAGPLAAPKQK